MTDEIKALAEKRRELALKSKAVARALGVSCGTLWAWETGNRFPRYANLVKWREFLKGEKK